MIQEKRIRNLNNKRRRTGKYVLYWMQAAQRCEYNHALEYSIQIANKLKMPVVILFGITDSYPEANLRHYRFMLEGLKDAKDSLEKRGIKLVVRHESPELAIVALAKNACFVVVDAGHTRIQRKWRQYAAKNIKCLLEEVETNLIVPVTEVSDKENFSAGTLRPRINKRLSEYLLKIKHSRPLYSSLDMKFNSFNINNVELAISKLNIDRSVKPVKTFTGGTTEAKRRLKDFIKNKLDLYADLRNDPCLDNT